MRKKKGAKLPQAPPSLVLALKKLDLRGKFAEVGEDRRQRLLREHHGNVVSELQRLRGQTTTVLPGLQDYIEGRKAQARAVALKIKK